MIFGAKIQIFRKLNTEIQDSSNWFLAQRFKYWKAKHRNSRIFSTKIQISEFLDKNMVTAPVWVICHVMALFHLYWFEEAQSFLKWIAFGLDHKSNEYWGARGKRLIWGFCFCSPSFSNMKMYLRLSDLETKATKTIVSTEKTFRTQEIKDKK